MQIINQGGRLAQMLAMKDIFIRVPERKAEEACRYNMYLGVPVHCLMAERCEGSPDEKDAQKSIDILICRDTQAVLAIVLDAEYRQMEEVFSDYLRKLPHYFLNSDELTDEKLQAMTEAIEMLLYKDSCIPQSTGCYLYAERAANVVSRLQDKEIEANAAQEGFDNFLHRKHLLRGDGSVTHYGRYCGLFMFCLPKQDSCVLMCKLGADDRLGKALRWTEDTEAVNGLAHRLNRMKRGLPSEHSYSARAAASVQALLDTPLEELFRNHPQEGSKVNALLNHGQMLSRDSAVTAFGDKEDITTYGDVIYAVWNLREYTALDADRSAEVMDTCEEILWNLSAALLEPAEKAPVPTQGDRRQSLIHRLEQLRDAKETYPVLSEPMSRYVCAGAFLSGSDFPIYLYDRGLSQYMAFYGYIDCSFRQALQHICNLRTSEDETEAMDYSMLIFDLLVDTVSGALV